VRSVPEQFHQCIGLAQRVVARKRAQQLIMARRRLVHAGDDRIDDPQSGRRCDMAGRHAVARSHVSAALRRVLERADDRRADRDDAPAFGTRPGDRLRRRHGNRVRLVER